MVLCSNVPNICLPVLLFFFVVPGIPFQGPTFQVDGQTCAVRFAINIYYNVYYCNELDITPSNKDPELISDWIVLFMQPLQSSYRPRAKIGL